MIVDAKLTEFKREGDLPPIYTLTVEVGDSRNGSVAYVPGLSWEQAMPLIYSGIPVEVVEEEEEK